MIDVLIQVLQEVAILFQKALDLDEFAEFMEALVLNDDLKEVTEGFRSFKSGLRNVLGKNELIVELFP